MLTQTLSKYTYLSDLFITQIKVTLEARFRDLGKKKNKKGMVKGGMDYLKQNGLFKTNKQIYPASTMLRGA